MKANQNNWLSKAEIIDDWGWDINGLPPVPTIENVEKYSNSGYWKDPYTDENIQEHILTVLKAKPHVTAAEIYKSDNFFSVFSKWAIEINIIRMVECGVISEDKSEITWRYSLPKWALR